MKKYIALLVTCMASSAFAQPSPINAAGESSEVVSMEKMPLGLPAGELDKMQKSMANRAPDGFSLIEKSPEKVKGFFAHLNTVKNTLASQSQATSHAQNDGSKAPQVHKNLSSLKLGFKAAAFDNGTLIAATPAGTKVENSWTGLDRFYQLQGTGVMRLTEYDLAQTGGKFLMAKEAINSSVGGKPAISRVFVNELGQTIEEIVWVSGRKFHMLTFSPDSAAAPQSQGTSRLSALSLASQLR